MRIEIVLGKRGHGRDPGSLTIVQIVESLTVITEHIPIIIKTEREIGVKTRFLDDCVKFLYILKSKKLVKGQIPAAFEIHLRRQYLLE